MPWPKKTSETIIANDKGEVREIEYKIKTDKLGNDTDIIYSDKGNFGSHAHAWGLNTQQSGYRSEGGRRNKKEKKWINWGGTMIEVDA